MIWQELPTRRNGPSLWWWKPMNRKLQTKIRYTMGESQNTQIVSRNTFTAASVGSIEKMLAGLFWINQSRTSLVVTVCGQNFQSFGYTADSPENSSQPRHTSPSWPGTSVCTGTHISGPTIDYVHICISSQYAHRAVSPCPCQTVCWQFIIGHITWLDTVDSMDTMDTLPNIT